MTEQRTATRRPTIAALIAAVVLTVAVAALVLESGGHSAKREPAPPAGITVQHLTNGGVYVEGHDCALVADYFAARGGATKRDGYACFTALPAGGIPLAR